jgi:hypothetical protein
MDWILEISTNPDVVRPVVELIPAMSKQPDVNIVPLCSKVRDMFKACFDQHGLAIYQDSALEYGKALIHFSENNLRAKLVLRDSTQGWNLWESWRALYLPRALEQCRISYGRMKEAVNPDTRKQHKVDTRTALRMAVATGMDEFTDPNDERLIWDGQFQLHYSEYPEDTCRFIEQLIGCVEYFYDVGDFDVAGDALLLASSIATTSFDDSDVCKEICLRITPLLNKTHRLPTTSRWRCVALSAALRFLDSHVYLSGDEPLSHGVLMAVCPPADSTIQNAGGNDEVQFTNAIYLFNFTK